LRYLCFQKVNNLRRGEAPQAPGKETRVWKSAAKEGGKKCRNMREWSITTVILWKSIPRAESLEAWAIGNKYYLPVPTSADVGETELYNPMLVATKH